MRISKPQLKDLKRLSTFTLTKFEANSMLHWIKATRLPRHLLKPVMQSSFFCYTCDFHLILKSDQKCRYFPVKASKGYLNQGTPLSYLNTSHIIQLRTRWPENRLKIKKIYLKIIYWLDKHIRKYCCYKISEYN